MEFTTIEKMAIIFFLGEIMEADSIIDSREVEFMDSMYERLDVQESDLDVLEMMDLEYSIRVITGMERDKIIFSKDAFEKMALADGYYHPLEKKMIDSLVSLGG